MTHKNTFNYIYLYTHNSGNIEQPIFYGKWFVGLGWGVFFWRVGVL